MAEMRERRGDWRTSTDRNPDTERKERERRGGSGYDAGPGREGLPSASEMDRPPSPCGAYSRYGDRRKGIDPETRKIQDTRGEY